MAAAYSISIGKLQGDFLSNHKVYLRDNLLDKTHDLTSCDYTFTSEVGEFKDRFDIVFNNKALSINDFNTDTNSLIILQIDDK